MGLQDAGLCSVSVSLDSYNALGHDQCRGRYSRTFIGLQALAKAGLSDIEINTTIHRGNTQEAVKLWSELRKHGYRACVRILTDSGVGQDSSWAVPNPKGLVAQMLECPHVDTYDQAFLQAYSHFFDKGRLGGRCKMGRSSFFVDTESRLLPCPFRTDLAWEDYVAVSEQNFVLECQLHFGQLGTWGQIYD